MAQFARAQAAPGIAFAPDPGPVEGDGDTSAVVTIVASAPVVWRWSSSGSMPTSNVPDGGTSSSITFTLSNLTHVSRTSFITLTADDESWNITLTASGTGIEA
jgi:hypothetical protein